ncbi:MAG: hypothetical protein APF80_15520 [Alphaproteobacteria bacterium BRH_c36]|nr:MAG: hypothetical protein APF80_15520 [Alphaproteobacteria bacterium BRH_c36]
MTIPATINHAVQQSQEWLKELRDTAGLADETEALSVFRLVLHQLRDRLNVEESVQLAAQLPLIFRGIYFEGWVPGHVPDKEVKTQQQLFDKLSLKMLPRTLPPEPMVKSVFAILAHHLDPGEISDVIGNLPGDLKNLWPLTARTYKERMR